uniref:TSA: Wollemia nobilis Ref_Wollemi_Transcript_29510_1090 transcribed RNA sequence n=1 Tax=Wollemia nobilis TaxID=56998 RepID=A0A0C9RFU3_9CONI
MTERVYPSNRPGVQNLNGAYTKGASVPRYRPEPEKERRNRCCLCCLWFTIVVVTLIVLVGIAALVLWILYRPQEPKFSVGALQISQLNVTKNTRLTSEVNLQLNARNPNKKVTFFYDEFSVKISSGDVDLAVGSVPGFFHGKKNITLVKADLKTKDLTIASSDAKKLKSAQSKGKISLDVDADTHVKVKVGKWKSHKIRVQVKCSDVATTISNTKKASDINSKCDLKVKFKIFKWYL